MPTDKISIRFNNIDQRPKEIIEKLSHSVHEELFLSCSDLAEDMLVYGRGLMITGKYESAAFFLKKCLGYFEQNNQTLHMYYTYINLGVVFRESESIEEALSSFQSAYDVSYELDDFVYIILALVNLGSIYSSFDQNKKALEYLEKAMEFIDRIPVGKTLGDLYNNYAYVLLEEGRIKESLSYFYKAEDVYKVYYGEAMHTNRIIVMGNIGETLYELGDFDAAEKQLLKTLELAQEKEMLLIEVDAHRVLALIYEKQGSFKLALEHLKLYDVLKDQLFNQKKKNEMQALNEKLKDEAQKSQDEIHTLRNVELKSKTTELEKTLKNLAQISTIGQKLTATMDMDEIYKILRFSVYELMAADVFGLAMYDYTAEVIKYKYFEEQGKPLPLLEIKADEEGSLAAYCIRNGQDIFIKDFYEEQGQYMPRTSFLGIGNDPSKDTQSIIYCRLLTEDGCIGLITMQSYAIGAYLQSDYEVIKALASYVAIAISNAQKKNIINEKAKELEFLSFRDPLTGLYNRRYFNVLSEEFVENRDERIGLIMGDMNNLKLINDNFGHMTGDGYLIEVAKILKRCAEENEVFRLGGDEFAVLVHDANEKKMNDLLLKIKTACDGYAFEHVPLTISLGYELVQDNDEDLAAVFSRAETKMYLEKNNFHREGHPKS